MLDIEVNGMKHREKRDTVTHVLLTGYLPGGGYPSVLSFKIQLQASMRLSRSQYFTACTVVRQANRHQINDSQAAFQPDAQVKTN